MPQSIDDIEFDLAVIDADSLLYMIAYTEPSPNVARKRLDEAITNIIEHVEASEAVVFVKGQNNFRYIVDIEYKQHRGKSIDDDVKERLDRLYEYAYETYITSDDAEADDYCYIYAEEALELGKCPIVCHIDKDLNMIPGWHYNFKKKESYFVSPESAYVFLMTQILTGDAADNIKGLPKVGPVKAANLLKDKQMSELLDIVLKEYKKVMGYNWQEHFVKVANCILIRNSFEELRPLDYDELLYRLAWELEDKVVDKQTAVDLGHLVVDSSFSKGTMTEKVWNNTDTGSHSPNDLKEPTDSSTQSSVQQEDNTSEEKPLSVNQES
jgi:hypothetical protein